MDDYDQKTQELSNQNELILKEFEEYLQKQLQVSTSECVEMMQAMRFFANEYIIHYHMEPLLQGLEYFESFVTDWFIRKCMWSNEFTVNLNGLTFMGLLQFLRSKGYEFTDLVTEQIERLPSIMQLAIARVNAYNDTKIDVEKLFDEYGFWNDEIVEKRQRRNTTKLRKSRLKAAAGHVAPGGEHLDVHVIVSAKVAKFLKIKPPQLLKLSEWDRDWKDPAIHWFSKWRCEECFAMKGTKTRVFMVTNEASRYSFLLRLDPGDCVALQSTLFSKMMKLLLDHDCIALSQKTMKIHYLSGSAASLTGTQNNLINYLDWVMERETLPYLDDYEKPLNGYLTTIGGEYRLPDREMERLLKENPPFTEPPHEPTNVIQFRN